MDTLESSKGAPLIDDLDGNEGFSHIGQAMPASESPRAQLDAHYPRNHRSSGPTRVKVFFGGKLFSSKDLIGNIFLQEALCRRCPENHVYDFYLAQNNCEQNVTHKIIKDNDIMGLVNSDVAIFAFDGVELDSGTVVEFLQAKTLDIPCVVYRTDFRGGSGEEAVDDKCNKWNLMVSFYPRTEILYLHSVVEYQKVHAMLCETEELRDREPSAESLANAYSDVLAGVIHNAMVRIRSTRPLLSHEERCRLREQCLRLWGVFLDEPAKAKRI